MSISSFILEFWPCVRIRLASVFRLTPSVEYLVTQPEFDRIAVESILKKEVRLDRRTLVPQKIELDLGEITLTDSLSDENVTLKLENT